jgi:2-amino-4-hydroxy-6-hydroxymethyldihydropteridine diphosphokinase
LAANVPVAIALGSNLGERQRYIEDAVRVLKASVDELRVSSFYDTAPVDVGDQPRFLNAAAVGVTSLTPRALLETLLDIERRCGRVRPYPGAPRTLDMDVVLYGQAVIDEPGLKVPHPRFRERRFVLQPLAEIAPFWVDPVTQRTIRDLLDALSPGSVETA